MIAKWLSEISCSINTIKLISQKKSQNSDVTRMHISNQPIYIKSSVFFQWHENKQASNVNQLSFSHAENIQKIRKKIQKILPYTEWRRKKSVAFDVKNKLKWVYLRLFLLRQKSKCHTNCTQKKMYDNPIIHGFAEIERLQFCDAKKMKLHAFLRGLTWTYSE